jgi:phosphoglycerate dehydrogenase-like enzyme
MPDLNKNILILDPFAIRYKELLAPLFPNVTFHAAAPDDDLRGFIAKAHAIFALDHFFNDNLLKQAQALEWAQALTTGYGTLLACESLKPDVIVTNTRGIHGPQMSELAFLHMIALSRNYPHMLRNQDRGEWQRWPQSLIYKKTAAILGIGAIAEELAPRLKAFGMKVIGISSTKRQVPGIDRMVGRDQMCEVLGEVDYFIVLIPYSPASDRIVNADVLAAMKPEAYLINLARGGVVDEDALLDALRTNKIAGAGLDVFKDRVLPADHPFWSMENVLITPMIGGMSDIYQEQALPILETNLRAFINGDTESMINVIDR